MNDDEHIVALVFKADAPDGVVLPTMFPAKRLRNGELSVSRQSLTSFEIVSSAVVAVRSTTVGECVGGLKASVAEIRSATIDDQISHKTDAVRLYCVTDDPDLDNDYPGHAVLGFSELTKPHGRGKFWERNKVAAVIGNLMLMFGALAGPIHLASLFVSNDNSEDLDQSSSSEEIDEFRGS